MTKALKRVELLKLLKKNNIGKWSEIFKLKKVELQKIAFDSGLINKDGFLLLKDEVESKVESKPVESKPVETEEVTEEVKAEIFQKDKPRQKKKISVPRHLGKQTKLQLTPFDSDDSEVEEQEQQQSYRERTHVKTRQSLKKYERELRDILKDYIEEVKNILSVYDRKNLDQYDAQDIFESYNQLTDDLENLVNDISDEAELSTGQNFSDRFLDGIERKIGLQKSKVENFVR